MADREKIQGSALLKLFTELKMNTVPLKMRLPDSNQLQPAYITDISKRKKALNFKVHSPAHLLKLSQETAFPHLKFEFTDQENINYVFETNTWKLLRKKLWIAMPEFVHRFQRRRLFRLEAPRGTRLFFNVNGVRYQLLVVNVSLSGTLGVLASLTERTERELKPFVSKFLKNAELLFPSEDYKKDGPIVNINYCQIKRMERNPATGKLELAVEFKKISGAEQQYLTELFYKWQRDYLRKRKIMRA